LFQIELPSWKALAANYPGYKHHGGDYNNIDIYALIGQAPLPELKKEDTSALRLSIALNKLGGAHRLGTDEFHITRNHDKDSVRGRDGQQYLFRTIAYGPLLAMKYKSPELYQPKPMEREHVLDNLQGRRGIVRMVTFHQELKKADARILLWDCDSFYESRDWVHIHHLISVEFWPLPGEKMFCAMVDAIY